MFTSISISGLILVVFIYVIFRKPVKTIVSQVNDNLPEIVAAASDAAVNSATSAAFNHRKEIDQQLQDEHGVTLDEVRQLYAAMASKKSRRNP